MAQTAATGARGAADVYQHISANPVSAARLELPRVPLLRKWGFAIALTMAPLFMPAAHAQVTAVAVGAGAQTGSGYAVGRGDDCIIITANHVVADEIMAPDGKVRIFDASGAEASGLKVLFQDPAADLAVLRVAATRTFSCQSTWQDGSGVQNALNQAASGTVEMQIVTMREGGQSDVNPVSFAGTSGPKNFRARAKGDSIAKGQSGSVVVSAGRILGIALGNDNGMVRILRQDQIHALAKSYATIDGYKILITPILYKGRAFDVAGTSAKRVLESSQGVTVSEAPADWIDRRTGDLKQTGDAQYVVRGKIIAMELTRATSNVGKAQNLGRNRNLGDLGKAIGDLSKLGQDLGMNSRVDNHALQLELSLTSAANGETLTELVTRQAQFPYASIHTAEINNEVELAVADGLTALLKRANIN